MDIKSFGYFECVCRRRSMARAASELGISIQGLTGSMHRLSQELNVPLLETKDGVTAPTEYGAAVLAYAKESQLSWQRMQQTISAIRAHDEGLVRLGAISGALGYFGEDCLDGGDEHPSAVLVCEGSQTEVEATLLAGGCDVAILCTPAQRIQASIPIVHDCFYLWVHKMNSLSLLSEIRPSDLNGQTLALFDFEEEMTLQVFDAVRESQATVKTKFVGEVMRVFELVHANKAVGLTCRNHVVATAGTDVVGIPMPFATFDYLLCLDRMRGLSAGEQALLNRLRDRAPGM